jgi:hypothetical protein
MRPAIIVCCVTLACLVAESAAQSSGWVRSRMEQGYYAASVANAAGARFRVDCGTAEDSDKTEAQSITYIPKLGASLTDAVEGTITIDGAAKQLTFHTTQDPPDPVEIQFEGEDLDSVEVLQDLVAQLRKARSLTVEVPTFNLRDTFSTTNVAKALGTCQ